MPTSYSKKDLKSLSREVQFLSTEMQQDPLFPIITLGRVLMSLLDQRTLEENELSVTKVLVLTTLVLNGGCLTLTLLSEKVFTPKSTISRIIGQLEDDGLALMGKHPIPEDKRFKRICVTQKGIELVRAQLPLRRRLSKEVTSFLTSEEISALCALSQKFLNHLPQSEARQNSYQQEELI